MQKVFEIGERACAVVALRAGADAFGLEAMRAFLGERGLARQKFPEQIEVVAELPRNASGKVLKNELRERYTT